MKKRRQREAEKRGPQPIRSRATLVAVCLIVTLGAGGAILAAGGGRWFAAKSNTPSPQSDPLAPGNPSKEYVYVGGRLLATEEPPGSPGCGSPPAIPGTPIATAEFTPLKVHLTWPASANADHYEVQRRQNADPFSTLSPNPNSNFLDDFNVVPNTAYVYRVRAVDAQAICPSEYSLVDLATTTNFPESVGTGVPIKAAHLLELATAVNAVRLTGGFPSGFTWGSTTPPAFGGSILKAQMQKLRDDLNPARVNIGLPQWPFTDNPLTQGVTPVYAVHVQQFRDAVK